MRVCRRRRGGGGEEKQGARMYLLRVGVCVERDSNRGSCRGLNRARTYLLRVGVRVEGLDQNGPRAGDVPSQPLFLPTTAGNSVTSGGGVGGRRREINVMRRRVKGV